MLAAVPWADSMMTFSQDYQLLATIHSIVPRDSQEIKNWSPWEHEANQSCVNMRKDKRCLLSNQFIYSCLKPQRPGYQDMEEQPNDMLEVLCQPTADNQRAKGVGTQQRYAQTPAAKNG